MQFCANADPKTVAMNAFVAHVRVLQLVGLRHSQVAAQETESALVRLRD
jgi:hypothetical protein